jgi:hypothetical protein
MTNQQLIKQIEFKIKEIKSTLTHWTKNIETYHNQLQTIIKQLNEIKLQIKEKK